jgi:hypothetical protein
VAVQIDGAGTVTVRIDGVVAGTATGAALDLGVTGSYFGNAVFGEIIAVVGPVTANQVTSVEQYLISKYTQ